MVRASEGNTKHKLQPRQPGRESWQSVKHGVQNISIKPEMFGWHLHRLLIARLVSNEEFYPGRKMSAFYQTGYQSRAFCDIC